MADPRSQEPPARQDSPQQQPIIVRQGGSSTAVGLIIAALILGGAAVWVVSIWSKTQIQMIEAPARVIEKGIKDATDALKPGS